MGRLVEVRLRWWCEGRIRRWAMNAEKAGRKED
jgi:hypothetical protein